MKCIICKFYGNRNGIVIVIFGRLPSCKLIIQRIEIWQFLTLNTIERYSSRVTNGNREIMECNCIVDKRRQVVNIVLSMTGGSPFQKRYIVIVLLTVFNSNPYHDEMR